MAAIRAAQLRKKVILLERNNSIGKKILMTGKGRCNITNSADIDVFLEKFGKQGKFFRSAFFAFSNQDLMNFFQSNGLELKIERQGRVFPVTDKATSVVRVISEALSANGVELADNKRVSDIKPGNGSFEIITEGREKIICKKVVLATGGLSYKATGSTGDGLRIAGKFGHKITPASPGLVPLVAKEAWLKELQGLALENIRITFKYGKSKIVSEIGELMFTHFGVSGPLVLDLSGKISILLAEHKDIGLFIDLKPGLEPEQLESKLLHKFQTKGNIHLKNLFKDILPQRLIAVFLNIAGIDPDRKTNQITSDQRRVIINLLKGLPLTITGTLLIEEAMVTGGGVSTEEIDPRTMESRLVPGLYFAGEVIDGAASSGGYNLQQAFSTGYLAGESAANA